MCCPYSGPTEVERAEFLWRGWEDLERKLARRGIADVRVHMRARKAWYRVVRLKTKRNF